jgi:DNA recombination-dependent growth factor C
MFVRLEAREDDGRSGGFEVLFLRPLYGRFGLVESVPDGWIKRLLEENFGNKDYDSLSKTGHFYKKDGAHIGWHLDIKVIDQEQYDAGVKKQKYNVDKAREEQLQRQKEYNERWDARMALVDSALAKLTDEEVMALGAHQYLNRRKS